MGWQALGDSAWIYRVGDGSRDVRLRRSLALAERLRSARIPGVVDVVNGYDTVAVYSHPLQLEEVGQRVLEWTDDISPGVETSGRVIEVPVCYGGEAGPDLVEAARRLGLTPEQVVERHSTAEFRVATIGFSPGFPYLAGLPESLHLPRKATPVRVKAGSVAIAGGQAGIYPSDSPAGWWVIGTTSLKCFDPLADPPSAVSPGDQIRFVPVDALDPIPRKVVRPADEGPVEVLEPGAITSLQDGGRTGFRKWGVASGGALDPVAMAVANAMAGNEADAAVLEVCMTGPKLRFHQPCRVAWVGWTGGARMREFGEGDELDLTPGLEWVRGTVAVAGGFLVESRMGSASTDVRGGFGGVHGRTILAGDRLRTGASSVGPAPGSWRVGWPKAPRRKGFMELRVVKGVQYYDFSKEARTDFCQQWFHVSTKSDRMGVRLEGEEIDSPREQMVSQPMVPGSVQIPPDGMPIVLMNEGQTLGGYPQMAHVISADLPLLARAWPGTSLRFREVSQEEAITAWRDLECHLGQLRTGLDFLKRK